MFYFSALTDRKRCISLTCTFSPCIRHMSVALIMDGLIWYQHTGSFDAANELQRSHVIAVLIIRNEKERMRFISLFKTNFFDFISNLNKPVYI